MISLPELTVRNFEKRVSISMNHLMELEKISGLSIEQLIEMFAAGWTLTPPKIADIGMLGSTIDEWHTDSWVKANPQLLNQKENEK